MLLPMLRQPRSSTYAHGSVPNGIMISMYNTSHNYLRSSYDLHKRESIYFDSHVHRLQLLRKVASRMLATPTSYWVWLLFMVQWKVHHWNFWIGNTAPRPMNINTNVMCLIAFELPGFCSKAFPDPGQSQDCLAISAYASLHTLHGFQCSHWLRHASRLPW